MQVQNITNLQFNSPKFKGKLDIIPGDLSYEPAKNVRKAYNSLQEMIKDKPYNLYIRQNHKNNTVKITAQKEKHFIKNKGLKAEGFLSSSADLYEEVASLVINSYEKKLQKSPKTFGQKLQERLNKAWHKFLNVMEIEDEVAQK